MEISDIVKIMLKVISNYLCSVSANLSADGRFLKIMYYGISGNMMLVSTLILLHFHKIISYCIMILL
jgi:uncharacterized membrane protein